MTSAAASTTLALGFAALLAAITNPTAPRYPSAGHGQQSCRASPAVPRDGDSPGAPLTLPLANSTPASEALEASLAHQFWERLRVFGARRLGDAALAEDLAQEVLRLVTEALRSGRINDRDALPGFVFQTATHLCLHHYRSRSREERALTRMAGMDSGTSDPGPLDILVTDEARRQVRSALGELKPDERDLLRRIYFDEEPSEETARRLRVTPGALRVRKFRALEHLAALLGKGR